MPRIHSSPDIAFRPRSNRRLSAALNAVDRLTDAPLRLAQHHFEIGREVFELIEEFEGGAIGRTICITVDRRSCRVLDVQLAT